MWLVASEWLLSPRIFRRICRKLGHPALDLFASRACHQLPMYMSWKPDPQCQAIDAFQQNWKLKGLVYAFPPFSLIGKVVRKVKTDMVSLILVTPSWPAQSWYNQVLELCIANPLLLPLDLDLLKSPQGQIHPLVENQSLRLVAWKISGKVFLQEAYQQGLRTLSSSLEGEALHLITNRPRESGHAGVVGNKLIPLIAI